MPEPNTVSRVKNGVPRYPLFHNDREAYFLRRLNRFRVEVMHPHEGSYTAHCPNPGRLMELLFPGTKVILERDRDLEGATLTPEEQGDSDRTSRNHRKYRKTDWTLVAVYPVGPAVPNGSGGRLKSGAPNHVVPLYASRLNHFAETLVLPRLFPGARRIQREARWGNSKFDFFVEDAKGRGHFLEIKGCTLVAYGTAMFPDAPSTRAVRHLQELERATQEGFGSHVIFIFSHGPAERFVPNLHTDPAFASTLSRVASRVRIHTYQIAADSGGWAWIQQEGIPVVLSHGQLAEEDRGSYLVSLFLEHEARITVGSLGERLFPQGWYVYAGSAQRGLTARVARHLRFRKKVHWHIDYLS
ncbi:MAG: DNA/RNA nuclease SfsA, partial [Spirochaetes bacterium]|nr:DNA/RNA nuclease SfsA [Spirochaetota bacterium]